MQDKIDTQAMDGGSVIDSIEEGVWSSEDGEEEVSNDESKNAEQRSVSYEVLEGNFSSGDAERHFKIKIPGEVVSLAVDKELSNVTNLSIRGFRSGQTPESALRALTQGGRKSIIENMVRTVYRMLCKNFNFRVLGEARFNVLESKHDVIFTLDMLVMENFTPPNLETVEITGYNILVSDADIDEEQENIFRDFKFSTELGSDAVVQIGDYVTFDSIGTFGEKKVQDLCVKDAALTIHEEHDSRWMKLALDLVGMGIGQLKTVTITIPDNYKSKSFRGREVQVELVVKKISRNLPARDKDDFMSREGMITEEEMRKEIKKKLEVRGQANIFDLQAHELKEKLCKMCEFNPPSANKKKDADKTTDIDNPSEDGQAEDSSQSIDGRFPWIMQSYAEKYKIYVAPSEIEELVRNRMTGDPETDRAIISMYNRLPDLLARVRNSLYANKTLSAMVKHAKKVNVKDVTIAELEHMVGEIKAVNEERKLANSLTEEKSDE